MYKGEWSSSSVFALLLRCSRRSNHIVERRGSWWDWELGAVWTYSCIRSRASYWLFGGVKTWKLLPRVSQAISSAPPPRVFIGFWGEPWAPGDLYDPLDALGRRTLLSCPWALYFFQNLIKHSSKYKKSSQKTVTNKSNVWWLNLIANVQVIRKKHAGLLSFNVLSYSWILMYTVSQILLKM